MRLGGIAAVAGPLLLGACALPANAVKSCDDRVAVHFPHGATQLNLDAVGQVLLAVSTLDACPSARVTITGHADRGEIKGLSAIRAANVASVLVKNGVARRRIQVRVAGLDSAARQPGEPDNRFVAVEWR